MTRSSITARNNLSALAATACFGAALSIGCGGPAATDDDPGQSARARIFTNPNFLAEATSSSWVIDERTAPILGRGGEPPTGTPAGPVKTDLVAGIAHRDGKAIYWATWLNSQRAPDERCGRRVIGPCVLYDCRGSSLDTGPSRVTGINAGDVTIQGAEVAHLFMPVDADGRYAPFSHMNTEEWTVGETVQFTSAGGPNMPSLHAALSFPDRLVFIDPRPNGDGSVWPVSRDKELPLRWQSVPDEVAVEIDETDGGRTPTLDDRTLLCGFAGDQGGGSVPADAMASLLPTSNFALPYTTLRIGRRATKTFVTGAAPTVISLVNATEIPLAVR